MSLTVISLSIFILTFRQINTTHYILYFRNEDPQLTYDEFKENLDELISQYRKDFSVPVFTDW